jgi:hypothetical protein
MKSQGGDDFCPKCLQFLPSNEPIKKPKSKYKNIACYEDGIRFDSKLERQYYNKLKSQRDSGEISYFLLQVPFMLPGKIKYVCDFMVVDKENQISYIDVKGVETRVFINKKKQVEALYPVKIEVIKK